MSKKKEEHRKRERVNEKSWKTKIKRERKEKEASEERWKERKTREKAGRIKTTG